MGSSMQVKIQYDDDILKIIDKINEVLEEHGLSLEDDMQEHDGFNIYSLVKKDE